MGPAAENICRARVVRKKSRRSTIISAEAASRIDTAETQQAYANDAACRRKTAHEMCFGALKPVKRRERDGDRRTWCNKTAVTDLAASLPCTLRPTAVKMACTSVREAAKGSTEMCGSVCGGEMSTDQRVCVTDDG